MSNCSIGIIAHRMSRGFGEIHYFRLFSEMAEKYDVPVIIFSVDDVDQGRKKIHALRYLSHKKRWVKEWFPFPKVVYDRVRYHATDQFRRYVRLRKSGLMNFSYHGYSHKLGVIQYLSTYPDLKPYLPETEKVESVEQIYQFVKNGPSIMKPINGTGGRDVYLIELTEKGLEVSGRSIGNQGRSISQATDLKQFINRLTEKESYLIQRKIPITFEGRNCDTRALFQKDHEGRWSFTGLGTRIGKAASVVSNLHAGASAIKTDEFIKHYIGKPAKPIINEIKEFGIKVGERLDQRYGNFVEFGLDIGITPEGTFQLIEANSKPARQIFKRTGQLKEYEASIRKPVEYHIYLCRKNPSS